MPHPHNCPVNIPDYTLDEPKPWITYPENNLSEHYLRLDSVAANIISKIHASYENPIDKQSTVKGKHKPAYELCYFLLLASTLEKNWVLYNKLIKDPKE